MPTSSSTVGVSFIDCLYSRKRYLLNIVGAALPKYVKKWIVGQKGKTVMGLKVCHPILSQEKTCFPDVRSDVSG